MKTKLTWANLERMLPLLNTRELERRAGLRYRRIADVKIGKSTLKEDELEKIHKIISAEAPILYTR